MKKIIKILLIFVLVLLSGCMSNHLNYTWVLVNKSGVSFTEANASCEAEIKKMGLSDMKISVEIYGMQHPTFVSCMNRYGYQLQKITGR